MAPSRSRFWRAWSRFVNGRACTSAPPGPEACTIWCTRWSITQWMRPWPATATRFWRCSTTTALAPSPTTAAASPPISTRAPVRAPLKPCSRCCTPAASLALVATRFLAACTALVCRWSMPSPSGWRSRFTAKTRCTPSALSAAPRLASCNQPLVRRAALEHRCALSPISRFSRPALSSTTKLSPRVYASWPTSMVGCGLSSVTTVLRPAMPLAKLTKRSISTKAVSRNTSPT